MSNNPYTFATRNLKADDVHVLDSYNDNGYTNITDIIPAFASESNSTFRRASKIQFLGQFVNVIEEGGITKVFIQENKNYPSPSKNITTQNIGTTANYYVYNNASDLDNHEWGDTYNLCNDILKDKISSSPSSWSNITISIEGTGNNDIHNNVKGFLISPDSRINVIVYKNGTEIANNKIDCSITASENNMTTGISVAYSGTMLEQDAANSGRTPGMIEVTGFKLTINPNTIIGSQEGGTLHYKVQLQPDKTVDDNYIELCYRTIDKAILYGVYNSNVSAEYTTSELTTVTRTVSGKSYICDGSSLKLKIDNAVNLTNGGTRKSKKIFDITVNGGTSKSYEYDNTTELNHTSINNGSDIVSFKNVQTINFDSRGYYGDYTVTPKLYDGNSKSKDISKSDSSESNTLATTAWANPKNLVSDMSESFAHSDNHTNANMKTKRLNPNNPKTEWSWNASTDAPTVPSENSNGSGKLIGVDGGERTHIRRICSSDTSSTGKFKITFSTATNWTNTENIKVFCAKYDPTVTDYNKLVWLMINCKQGNYYDGIEGICKETVSNTIKEFNCDIPASLGSFAKNEGLFIKIALTGASSTVYPYTVTFL